MTEYGRALLFVTLTAAAPQALAQTFAGNEIVARTADEIATEIATHCVELQDDHEGIANLVDRLIKPHFDLRRASRAILAEYWDKASPAEQERFVKAFYAYHVAKYGDLLLQFKFDTLRVLPFDGDPAYSPARVHTIVTLTDRTEVDVDFVMARSGDDWLVVDVEAEGVSYVKTYRSQYRIDIATGGIGSVIEWLEKKAASPAPHSKGC